MKTLRADQAEGLACADCGEVLEVSVPTGAYGPAGAPLFRCDPPCLLRHPANQAALRGIVATLEQCMDAAVRREADLERLEAAARVTEAEIARVGELLHRLEGWISRRRVTAPG